MTEKNTVIAEIQKREPERANNRILKELKRRNSAKEKREKIKTVRNSSSGSLGTENKNGLKRITTNDWEKQKRIEA